MLAFVSAVVSAVFYFFNTQYENASLLKKARAVFWVQAISVTGIFIVLFMLIFQHKYEYFYAWRHSSNSLPVYYMISCFWEGQEGSFLLWMFWNAVLGLILIRTAGKFESPVLFVVSLAQIALGTMLLGIHIGDYSIGSNPFDLLREQKPELLAGIPMAAGKAQYLKMITDGNGLNPLLQNYWMVIHPPTLFFGFASVLVPFAFSIAGLWKDYGREWIRPALSWSLLSVAILGTGIIMGGFWAYESLTFGGYWAWDPVENASLMPWLIMASAAHMLIISKATGRHLFSAHLLIQLSFWLVLYATFLTRSGILGETSVHSFTDLGLSGQLLLFLFGFIAVSLAVASQNEKHRRYIIYGFLAIVLLEINLNIFIHGSSAEGVKTTLKIFNIALFFLSVSWYFYSLYKRTKSQMEDEKWTSREFWMFVGAMFLILSLVQVFSATSIPVFNKLFGLDTAVPKEATYNKIQVWLAMPVMLLMAVGQWFRYRETPYKPLRKNLIFTGSIALFLSAVIIWTLGIREFKYALFLFCAVWLIVGNVMYFGKKKGLTWLTYGASVAHTGFGILLMGVLISSVNKNVITGSDKGIQLAPETDEKGRFNESGARFNRENMILYQDEPVTLNGYKAIYRSKRKGKGADSISSYYRVDFYRQNKQGLTVDSFSLEPKAQNNPKMGLISEPSTRHYLTEDVFTHINHESDMDRTEPFSGFKSDTLQMGATFLTSSGKVILRLDSVRTLTYQNFRIYQYAILAKSLVDSAMLHPFYAMDTTSNAEEAMTDQSDRLGVIVKAEKPGKSNTFFVMTGERSPKKNYIVLKAIEFPGINLVWAGTIIMVVGFAMAIVNRYRQQKALDVA